MCRFILPSISFKVEKWKWNEEYRIYVSSLGHFKDEHKRNIPVKISSKTGYCNVMTACGFKVAHRLVLLTFRPIPNAEDLTVDHLNHNKRDNSLSNLEWVTKVENQERAKTDLLRDQHLKSEVVLSTTKMVCGGNAMFVDFNTAAEFVMLACLKNGKQVIKKENVIEKIKKAIQYGNTYCGIKWKIKEIRKEDNYVN